MKQTVCSIVDVRFFEIIAIQSILSLPLSVCQKRIYQCLQLAVK